MNKPLTNNSYSVSYLNSSLVDCLIYEHIL